MMRGLKILLFVLLSHACIARPAAVGAKAITATARPVKSDAEIQQTLEAKLAKSKIGKDGFRFRVANGVVTWEGRTDVVQHKGAATRMAKSAGASRVVNNIQVSGAGKAKAIQGLKKAAVQEN